MAIETKNIALDGLTYTLDDRDRVAAQVALQHSNAGAHFKYAAGSGFGPTDLVVGKGGSDDNTADPFTQSSTQLFPLGTKLMYGERTYRYAFSGEANNAGVLLEGAALVNANHRDIAVQAASTGTTLAVTLGATATTADQYAEGFAHLNDDTADVNSQGKLFKIKTHAAADAAATATFTLYDTIDVSIPTTGKVDLILNPYKDVVKCATSPVNTALGVTPIEIADDRYFWLQTGGPASVLIADAVAVLGHPVVRNVGTAGSARGIDSDSDTLNGIIGTTMVVNGAGDQAVIWLNLDW